MTAVLIHASGIHLSQGKLNWERTIGRLVAFRTGAVAGALADWELAELEELHPNGRAQFWGTHDSDRNRQRIQQIAPGDVVVFTGKKRVLGFGRVGLLTDNVTLGNALWPPHPDHGPYRHVYTLAPLQFVDMPQVDFRRRGEFGEKDDFRGLRVLTDDRAEGFIAAFAPEIPDPVTRRAPSPAERALEDARAYETADEAVAQDLSWVRQVDIEVRASGDVAVRARAAGTMHRGESLLVHDYVAKLPPDATWARFVTTVGVTDLDVWQGGRHELIEAKSSAGRVHVRQALAQLLDYAPALAEDPPDVLTALFPRRPDDSAIALLDRYGIDCVYREDSGGYRRLEAPDTARAAIGSMRGLS